MKQILLLTLLSWWSYTSHAAVLFEQPHTGTGAILMSSRYQPNGTDYDQFVWDSFSVPTAQAVTEIRWRGGYQPDMAYWGGDILNFKVSIYESTPGLSQPHLGPGYPGNPATLVSYDTWDKAGEVSVGVFGGVAIFDYHLVLPTVFQAVAGKLYWVQIEAEMGNGLPYWGFATGTGNGSHFRRIAGQADYYFQYAPGDAAFSILTADGPTYTVAASASPAGSGTIANTGLYPNGSAAPLVATPEAGFAFLNWTDNGTVVSTAPNYTFTVTNNRTLVANFAAGSVIKTTSSPLLGGNTDGGGTFVNGRSITVEAVPSANYAFLNWTENSAPVSTSPAYTFTVTADRDLVANFTPTAANPAIVFSQPPTNSATLMLSSYQLPDGNVDGMEYRFEKFTLASTTGFTQIRWRGGYVGNNQAANPVVEFIIKIYGSTANGFYPDLANPYLKKYTITGNANETAAAVIGGVQMFDYSVTLPTSFLATNGVPYWIQIAASQYGYPLTWGFAAGSGGDNTHYRRVGNSYYGGSGDLAISLSAPATTSYAIAASSANPSGGTVSGAGTYALGANVALLAMPQTGYALVNWTEDGVIVTNAATYRFAAAANRTLIAHFAPTYQVTLTSSSTTMGTVSGAGTYLTGSSVTAFANAKPGYVLLNWTDYGNPVSTQTNYTFTIVSNRNLRANFMAGYTISASAQPVAGGTVSGACNYGSGSNVTLLATPAPGYSFSNWTQAGVAISPLPSYSFPATSNRTLVANFTLTIPELRLMSSAPNSLVLNWPASLPGWQLQESPDLSPGSWTNSARTPDIVEDQRRVLIATPGGNGFFRLTHP
jgi:hypothetical protein